MAVKRRETEVIVVGAGPVGLMLAGELRLGGVDVVVLERLSAPARESRASQLNARTMEIFDQRDLLSRLDEPTRESAGHFGGLPLHVGGLASVHAGHWKIPQYRTEAMLQAWVAELGVELLRGHELRDLEAHPKYVEAEVSANAGPLRLRAEYLVGCDGEESTVRRLGGFDFPGKDATKELLRADVSGIDIPDRRFQRLKHGIAIAATRDGVTRVMMHEFDRPSAVRSKAPEFAEIVSAWAKITGEDLSGGNPIWVDAFDNTSRQVSRYRRDRVLLAGDAAHRQMPVGGQALNLGLQDAVNLGWKLAAQVRDWAPPGLLDSYHEERHPVGARVLTNIEAQALLLLGDHQTEAIRTVFVELLGLDSARRHLAEMVSGINIRYDVGPGEHPLLGARIPHHELRTESRPCSTTALLRPARGVLLDFGSGTPADEEVRATAAKWSSRVHTVRAQAVQGSPPPEIGAALVRPDGHVAWIDSGAAELYTALERWFGAPETAEKSSPPQPRSPAQTPIPAVICPRRRNRE